MPKNLHFYQFPNSMTDHTFHWFINFDCYCYLIVQILNHSLQYLHLFLHQFQESFSFCLTSFLSLLFLLFHASSIISQYLKIYYTNLYYFHSYYQLSHRSQNLEGFFTFYSPLDLDLVNHLDLIEIIILDDLN